MYVSTPVFEDMNFFSQVKNKNKCWVVKTVNCPDYSFGVCPELFPSLLPSCAPGRWSLWTASWRTPCHRTSFWGPTSGRWTLVGAQRAGKENCYVLVLLLWSSCHGSGGTAFNAPSRWPSSMLQGCSWLQYHGPSSSAFPLGMVAALLCPVMGGFTQLWWVFTFYKCPFIKLFSVKFLCTAICILLGLTKPSWRNYHCSPKNPGGRENKPPLGSQQAVQTRHARYTACPIPPTEPACLTIFLFSINRDSILLVSQAPNLTLSLTLAFSQNLHSVHQQVLAVLPEKHVQNVNTFSQPTFMILDKPSWHLTWNIAMAPPGCCHPSYEDADTLPRSHTQASRQNDLLQCELIEWGLCQSFL